MKLRKLLLTGMALCSLTIFAQTHTQGIEYYKADQFNNAQELLKRNLNNPGTDKSLSYYYLGQIALRGKNPSEASKYFNDGIQADSQNPYNYVGLGYIALKNGDLKGAEKYFKDAEKLAKKDQTVNVEIARAYYEADPVAYKEKYEKIIANALKKDQKNPDIYIFQGDVLRDEAYATGDSKTYGSAAAKYDMATGYDPQSAVAYVKYADMYMNAKNPGYAIIKLEELVKNNPSSALGQRELANAYYESQKYDKAVEQYSKYVKNPNHFKSDEDQYALLLFFDGDYQQGYDYATSLLSENPNNFTARRFQFMNAAQIDAMQDSLLPMAEQLYAEHKKDKANMFASIDYNLVSEIFSKAGRNDDAVAVLQEAIQDNPTNANFEKTLSSIYINAEDYAKASDAYENFINKSENPGYNEFIQEANLAYYAGATTNDNAYLQKAKLYANKAKDANANQYKPYMILGNIDIVSAAPDKVGIVAVDNYTQAANLLEANPDPRYDTDAKTIYKYLGANYVEAKDIANAKKYLGKYLELNPSDDTIRKVYNSL